MQPGINTSDHAGPRPHLRSHNSITECDLVCHELCYFFWVHGASVLMRDTYPCNQVKIFMSRSFLIQLMLGLSSRVGSVATARLLVTFF